MLERININYRDFDEKSFNVYAPVDETAKKTNELFEQALELEPRTNGEKEVYADYLKTLENITAAYSELQNIQHRLSLLATSSENVADVITQLEKIALKPAAIIYSRTQDLFILESTKELNNMIQRAKNKKKALTEKMETKNIVRHKAKNVYDVLSKYNLVFASIFFVIGFVSIMNADGYFFGGYIGNNDNIHIYTQNFVSFCISIVSEAASAVASIILLPNSTKQKTNIASLGISAGFLLLFGLALLGSGI
jgi:hypothetical protein